MSRRIKQRAMVPESRNETPRTTSHFRRRVQVMRKPVAAPVREAAMMGTMRRRPEEVADSRRTAW